MEGSRKSLSSRSLIGAEVIELVSGAVLGSVYDSLIDLDSFEVAYLGLIPAYWYQGGTVLPISHIRGFDENVVLIERASQLVSLQGKESSKDKKALVGVRHLQGRIVVSSSGDVIGGLLGISFDRSGKILGVEVEKEVLQKNLAITRIIAVGDKYIVVELVAEGEGAKAGGEQESGRADKPTEADKAKQASKLKVASPTPAKGEASDPAVRRVDLPGELSQFAGTSQLKARRLDNIVGKTSPTTIVNRLGEAIVHSGDILTLSVVNRLLNEGLLSELFHAFPNDQEADA